MEQRLADAEQRHRDALIRAARDEMNGERLSLRTKMGEIDLRGSLVVLVVVMIACSAAISYLLHLNARTAEAGFTAILLALKEQGVRQETEHMRRAAEHAAIVRGGDRTSCIISLDPATERKKFREEWKPGSYEKWCPWIAETVVMPDTTRPR